MLTPGASAQGQPAPALTAMGSAQEEPGAVTFPITGVRGLVDQALRSDRLIARILLHTAGSACILVG
jgi:hypothetical protein